jgi:hypothetical protein
LPELLHLLPPVVAVVVLLQSQHERHPLKTRRSNKIMIFSLIVLYILMPCVPVIYWCRACPYIYNIIRMIMPDTYILYRM